MTHPRVGEERELTGVKAMLLLVTAVALLWSGVSVLSFTYDVTIAEGLQLTAAVFAVRNLTRLVGSSGDPLVDYAVDRTAVRHGG